MEKLGSRIVRNLIVDHYKKCQTFEELAERDRRSLSVVESRGQRARAKIKEAILDPSMN
jgi:DNA-directed RNA polymerase specialized sigma24 family protein